MRTVIVLLAMVATAEASPPALGSRAAIVVDTSTGADLLAANADEVRPIASLTKIFVALVLRRRHLDLDKWTAITNTDAAAAEGGALSYLPRGQVFRNHDLLHAMLLVSENRVPTALARSVGLSPDELIAAMNALAADLGLEHTTFVDATGILENKSTARELALALRATLADPVLARIMRTREVRFTSRDQSKTVELVSTVRPLWERYPVRGGKTGHSDAAGFCMLTGAQIAKRSVVMAFLDSPTSAERYADYVRVAKWLVEHGGTTSRPRR